MEHLAIDLGASRSAICILNEGAIVLERELATRDLDGFLAKRPVSTVVMESCAESRKVALMAREHGHEVRVVPTSFVRALGVGARRIKTDKRDAKSLALASFRLGDQLPQVHVRCDDAAAIQDVVRARASLVDMRTRAINFVRAQLRKDLRGRPRSTPATFTEQVHALFAKEMMPKEVSTHLATIDKLNEQIAELDAEMAQLAKCEAAKQLQTVPGVGPIIALAFLAAIDDPHRFASAAHVASYLGLSPGENTTGGKVRRTSLIAAGQKQLRALLVQGAHSMLNARRLDPLGLWAKGLARRRGRKLAVCALARRMAVILWAMLRDGTRYDPNKTRPRHPTAEAASHSNQTAGAPSVSASSRRTPARMQVPAV